MVKTVMKFRENKPEREENGNTKDREGIKEQSVLDKLRANTQSQP